MNRSKTTLLSLASQAMLSAFGASSFLHNDTRHAGPLDANYIGLGTLNIVDGTDTSNAGGEAIKSDDSTVLDKGTLVDEGIEQTQQQAETASAAAPGTEIDKKVDDPARRMGNDQLGFSLVELMRFLLGGAVAAVAITNIPRFLG